MRTLKPTGKADVPRYVQEAWEINERINARAHTHAVDDPSIDGGFDDLGARPTQDDVIEISSDEDDEGVFAIEYAAYGGLLLVPEGFVAVLVKENLA